MTRSTNASRFLMEDADAAEQDILDAEQDEHTQKLLLRAALKTETVDKEDLQSYLDETRRLWQTFLKLPFTIAFFTLFIMGSLAHEMVPDSALVQRELRGMLTGTTYEGVPYTSGHKDLGDIDTKEDIYTYLQEVIAPLFINKVGTPRPDRHRVLRYNLLIGGVQLQQVRRKRVDCSSEYPDLGPFTGSSKTNPILSQYGCYPWYTESEEAFGPGLDASAPRWKREGFLPDSYEWPREASIDSASRRLDFVPDGGGSGGSSKGARSVPTLDQTFSLYLYEHEGVDRAHEKIAHLAKDEWIDFNTAWVGIKMFVLNPDMAIFVHVTVNIYFSPSGALLPKVTAQSFLPEPYQYMSVIGYDIGWAILLFYLVGSVLYRFYLATKSAKLPSFFKDPWNLLDVVVAGGGVAIIILWLMVNDKLVAVKSKAMAVRLGEPGGQSDSALGFQSEIYPDLVSALHVELDRFSEFLDLWRTILCLYTIVMSMKFLQSFAAQPRLAVVTSTISGSAVDLFHFLIVQGIIFLSYVVAGMFLFGRRLWSFSSLGEAIHTCFLIMLGDFDWGELGAEYPNTAMLWFWTYMLVMMLLMLNMLMAIIMDKYSEVKADAESTAPIWIQCYQMAKDKADEISGKMASNPDLIRIVESMPDHNIDSEMFMAHAGPSNLSKEQASGIISKTIERVDNELNGGVTMSEAMRMIGWVNIAVHKIRWELDNILEEEQEERIMLQGNTEVAPHMDFADPHVLAISDVEDASAWRGKAFVGDSKGALDNSEQAMTRIESFVQEALQYSTFRGKDFRNRVAVIEDLLRSQRDATLIGLDRESYDAPSRQDWAR